MTSRRKTKTGSKFKQQLYAKFYICVASQRKQNNNSVLHLYQSPLQGKRLYNKDVWFMDERKLEK
ncbi:hypothetical protein C1H46_045697 [Malus baccata]|uniref:Uncharacterized protein n=1 Tax=Malus baccata TaxID=106549 RepID=A0A540K3I0_MALBA|nr:hypothetical protein C1H46_045697 [Malus baccata]